jgi:hypothetical protein
MFVSKTALLVIDLQEFFQHRPYPSNDDLPGLLERLQDLVDEAKARDIPETNITNVAIVLTMAPRCLGNSGASCLVAFSNNLVWRVQ